MTIASARLGAPESPRASGSRLSPPADPIADFRRVVQAGVLPTLEQSAAVLEALDVACLNLATERIRRQLTASLIVSLKAANEELRGLVDSMLKEEWDAQMATRDRES